MSEYPSIAELRDIGLDDLELGRAQVRTRDVSKDIEELANSIRKVGLLEPIIVCPGSKPGKYEIITGQRRYLACRTIGRPNMRAAVLPQRVGEIQAKVISVTENLVRRDLNPRDLIDVCTFLYKKYGTLKAVCEETGLPYAKVSKSVKYDRLVPELKDRVDQGLDVRVALRAQEAASVSGETIVSEALRYADEMTGMSGVNQANLVEIRKASPGKAVDEVIADAKTGARITPILVMLTDAAHQSLQRYSNDNDLTQADAAALLINEGLLESGYLEGERA